MLSMRDWDVQECVRQDRLRESKHQRLVKLVSQQKQSRRKNLLNQLQNRSNHLRRQVENRSLAS